MSTTTTDFTITRRNSAHGGTLEVRARREVVRDVIELTLSRPEGERLPDWAPGAHIDIVLPNGTTRQYSLLGDRWDPYAFTIAVQRDRAGRGGSEYLHTRLRVGDTVGFGGPRNNFRLHPASDYLFIAGGIGITPILPMIHQAELLGDTWKLLYLGGTRSRMAYLDELAAYGDRVQVHLRDEHGPLALASRMPGRDAGTAVYACGPERLLDEMARWHDARGAARVRWERFTASAEASKVRAAFEVELAGSGQVVTVSAEETVVEALHRVGIDVLTSCAQGICGTCETGVVSGIPDHRDALLTAQERAASTCMFPCISRAVSPRLILDL
ncbi:MAG: PDR/VanB family oxidoreductase [Actinobacteria bacterium]|nr:PDR/VanB family oxidoreductase [Actinomycetota bacterium]